MCYISGSKRKKMITQLVEMGHCKGQTYILRQTTGVFRNEVGDSFWRTPGGKHQKEDSLLSFQ